MSMHPATRHTSDESGFSLIEVLVSMGIMLLVLAGTMSIMSDAMKSQRTMKDVLDMNSHLRASMDLIQRDLLQVGQGLPVGRRIGIPNDVGSTAIVRPGPTLAQAGALCGGVTTFPAAPSIPAVSVGPGRGPALSGECTDVLTMLAADNTFGPVPVAAIAADGASADIHNSVNISDDPDAAGDNLRAGDLLMITKGSASVLMQVTLVAGQTVTFGTGANDPLGLNQLDTQLDILGTINQLKATVPIDPDAPVVIAGVQQQGPSQATRIRMVTYFVDGSLDPVNPRLVRVVNGGQANAVGLGVQAFRISYDIANQVTNPTSVRMNAADLDGTGACANAATAGPDPCSENQIRKVNVVLSMKAFQPGASSLFRGNHTQNTLVTQVSLRSMAFVDRYR